MTDLERTTPESPRRAKRWLVSPFDRATRGRPDGVHPGVRAYYEHTWKDFRGVWMDRSNRALHFGWWDDAVDDHGRSLDRANEVLLDTVGLGPGQRCLDAGCGVGGTAMWAAEQRWATVVGVTLVPDQAVRFARYAADRGLSSRTIPVIGDYARLPLADDSFDVVYAQEALCHAPDKGALLDELWRVLRPGGSLVAMEYVKADRAPSPHYARWLDDWVMPGLFEDAWLRHWLAARSADAELRDVSEPMRQSLRHLYRISRRTYPVQAVLHRARLRSDVQIANIRGSITQWRSRRAGDWYFALIRARKPDPMGPPHPAGR